jgi:hypothetical protein
MARVEKVGADQSFAWRPYVFEDDSGTWLDAGMVTGGSPHKISTGMIESNSIGGRQKRRLGRYGLEGSIDGDVLPETLELLQECCPTAGVLPELEFGIVTGHDTEVHGPAVCSSWSLKGSIDGPLQFSLAWVAKGDPGWTPDAVAIPTTDLITDYEMALTFGGALVVRSFTLTVDYKATQNSGGIRRGADDLQRLKTGGLLYNGTPNVEIDLELEVGPTAIDFLGDCPTPGDFVVDIEGACGVSPYTATVTVANCMWQVDDAASYEGDASGIVLWKGKLIQMDASAPVIVSPVV